MVDLSALPPTFTTAEARASGVHSRDLYESRNLGVIIELSRGVVRHADAPPAALGALYRYLRRRDARPAELLRIAAALGVYGPIRRAVDIASAG